MLFFVYQVKIPYLSQLLICFSDHLLSLHCQKILTTINLTSLHFLLFFLSIFLYLSNIWLFHLKIFNLIFFILQTDFQVSLWLSLNFDSLHSAFYFHDLIYYFSLNFINSSSLVFQIISAANLNSQFESLVFLMILDVIFLFDLTHFLNQKYEPLIFNFILR
jgi:hypothetical protein